MSAVTATEGRAAAGVPVRGLTVLYDARCALCTHLRGWLARQPQLVPLDLVPAGSEWARTHFPGLDHAATLDEITVVGDSGQVYTGSRAWIVVLWALREHRPLAHRLSTPSGAWLARGAVLAAAKWRDGAGRRGTRAPSAAGRGVPARNVARQGAPAWHAATQGNAARGAGAQGNAARGTGAPAAGVTHRRPDGWVYHPAQGWVHDPPSCSDGSCATR
ncbi:thiol-disulfide oxidoreductase DCC family protein [Streptomyces sp. NBC_00820]|uniref:thiol-disulfide oxidoreductase DCC family protein n=1 Tax=Streptomyces sp. NBC_00820 TaxID=2975842 RepID=UPI003FA6C9D9